MEPKKRWFSRCLGCLSIMAMESEGRPPARMRCSACEGAVEIMGQVHYQRIVNIEEHTPCDRRCTMASGPSCDCQCGGKNHGSQITVTIARDVGGIPRITPPNPEKARRTHSEWLQAKAQIEIRINKHFPAYAESRNPMQRLSAFEDAQAARAGKYMTEVLAAGNLKTHHGRLQALQKINNKISQGAR